MTTSPWPSEWMRGVLEACVLRVLADGPTYGYAIAARLDELGLGAPKGGTLYPLLGRLEEDGLVVAQWRAGDGGPGRKYFTLTPAGQQARTALATSWTRFAALTTAVVAAPVDPADPD